MSIANRFDEAVPAALQATDSPVIGQSPRMNAVVPAAKSLAALGRHEEALEIVQKVFGPMIDSQRDRLQASRLVALALICHALLHLDRVTEVAGVAQALSGEFLGGDHEVRTQLADIIGGDADFAALPVPDPADLTPDRVATLIDDLIAEIRDLIADDTPAVVEGR